MSLNSPSASLPVRLDNAASYLRRELPSSDYIDSWFLGEFMDLYPVFERFLASGQARAAFLIPDELHPYNSQCVAKLALTDGYCLQNMRESSNWQSVKKTRVSPHFAPVYASAENGGWLLQQRIDGSGDERTMTKLNTVFEAASIPAFDVDYTNVGVIDGVPVIFDYPWRRFCCL